MSDSVRPRRWQPTRLPRPWDSPGKNTGVGCHFLLQCMTVKSESQVAQSCPTLSDPMDCSLPGSSVHGFVQARALEWVASAFSNGRAKARKDHVCVLSSLACLTLCEPMYSSPPLSSVHRIFQQEYWHGLPFPPPVYLLTLGSNPNLLHRQTGSLPPSFLGSPVGTINPIPRNSRPLQALVYFLMHK